MPRICEPEVMDDPALTPTAHEAALRGLARLNGLSGSAAILWPPIAALARQLGRPLRVLDVASGAGDVPLRLWRRAERQGLPLEIHGVDISPRAVAHARQRAERWRAPVCFAPLDVLAEPLPTGFDVVTSSLFLHHLKPADAAALLCRMADVAEHLVLVNDLRRSKPGLALARCAAWLFTRSPVVHVDAPRSVRAAFSLREAEQLAAEAGLARATVARRWPFRFLLKWERPQ